MDQTAAGEKYLSIDIGGSHIKATILNEQGELQLDYQRTATPEPASPENVINCIKSLVKDFPSYDKVSVGFPGYVKKGVIMTAPNLNTDIWKEVNLCDLLNKTLQKPVRIVNDADMLGLGIINGKGFEMVITLGTGFGTAFLMDGMLLPHLELAHHPVSSKGVTYDDYVGEKALDDKGPDKWNERMQKVMEILKTVFNYDYLYIGGGNAKKLSFPLAPNMKLFSNKDGIKGGARLWKLDEKSFV